jgi:hypothetical protein
MLWAGWTETMRSLDKYAILATIGEQWSQSQMEHRGNSVGGGVQKQNKGLRRAKNNIPASSGVRIFNEGAAMLSV